MDAEDYRHLVAALFPCASVRGRRTAAVAVEHELLTADVATGAAVAGRPAPGGRGRSALRAVRRVRARRPGRAQLALRPRRDRLGAAGTRRTLPRCAPAASRPASAWSRARSTSGPSPRCRCSWTAAVRRHAAALRHDRPGGSADDAPHGVHPGLPGLVGRRSRAGAVAGAASWPAPSWRRRFARPGLGSGWLTWLAVDPDAHRRSTDGCCAATTRCRRTPASPPGATPFVAAGEQHLTTLFPAGPAARPLPRGALPRRAAEHDGIAEVVVAVLAALVHDDAIRTAGAAPAGRGRAPAGSSTGPTRRTVATDVAGRGHELVALTRVRLERCGMSGVLFVTDPLDGAARPTSTPASG